MSVTFLNTKASDSKPIWLIATNADLPAELPASAKKWAELHEFTGKLKQFLLVPDDNGQIVGALLGVGCGTACGCDGAKIDRYNYKYNPYDRLYISNVLDKLPAGAWHFVGDLSDTSLQFLSLAFKSYKFTKYKSKDDSKALSFYVPSDVDYKELGAWSEAAKFGSDLINMPSNDLGPDQFEEAVRSLLAKFPDAKLEVIKGDELLEKNFPLIHAVGKSGKLYQEPRLLDFTWGKDSDPKVTLVGKGVCFDTGGYQIKPAGSMLGMQKDMGGAANVLTLAYMIMSAGLPVRLRVLLPVVENLVSQFAFRPNDIFKSRKGLTVEIGNTDAEGRLILADALAYADEESPDMLLDMATLTGAARVAVGSDIVPLYCTDDAVSASLVAKGKELIDPLCAMPLWEPYTYRLESRVADMNNISFDGHAGSIVAACFLGKFVENAKCWLHFDIFASNAKGSQVNPLGNVIQGVRSVYAFLKEKNGKLN